METTEKIKAGTIRIENGRIIGLGMSGEDSINLSALNELMRQITPSELSEMLGDTVRRIGSLAIYLYKAGLSVPDPSGAIMCGIPDEDALYDLHELSKLFRS